MHIKSMFSTLDENRDAKRPVESLNEHKLKVSYDLSYKLILIFHKCLHAVLLQLEMSCRKKTLQNIISVHEKTIWYYYVLLYTELYISKDPSHHIQLFKVSHGVSFGISHEISHASFIHRPGKGPECQDLPSFSAQPAGRIPESIKRERSSPPK